MDKTSYTQCRLEKPEGTGVRTQTAWIPTSLAKLGRFVELKKDESWEGGWKVAEKYGTKKFEDLDNQRKVHKRFNEVLN